MPRRMEITSPVPPTTTAARIIPLILIFVPPNKMIPEKPKNAIDISPAVTITIGIPCQDSGMSLYSIFSRIPARITIAIVNPIEIPRPYTTDCKILYPYCTEF